MFLARIILCAALALLAAAGSQRLRHARADGTIMSPRSHRMSSSAGGRRRGPRGGWHLHRRPSLISAAVRSHPRSSITSSSPVHHNADILLSRTRGGSTEEDGDADATADAVVVSDAEETTAAAVAAVAVVVAADDDVDVAASDSNDAASSPPGNATEVPGEHPLTTRNLTFPATKSHDGSLEDPDGIPARFLLMKKNDRAEARAAFEATLSWRREYGVDTILSRPHPGYDVCKAALPHYFSGRDPHGNVVLVQRPAALDFELMRKNNSTIDDLLMHYVYVIEYCWNVLEPGPPDREMTNVLDMRGMTFGIVRNQEYIGFGKRFVHMMSENYPGRSYKTLVINAPKWFHALYKIFKPVLRESTRRKIVILKAGEQQDTALRFYLGDSLPRDLISEGGRDDVAGEETTPGARYFLPVEERGDCEPGPNSLLEFDMRQFVSFPLVFTGGLSCESLLFFDTFSITSSFCVCHLVKCIFSMIVHRAIKVAQCDYAGSNMKSKFTITNRYNIRPKL
jgi:hypothetical protein